MNSKIEDRSLSVMEILPFQFFIGENTEPIESYNDSGELGFSSLQFFLSLMTFVPYK